MSGARAEILGRIRHALGERPPRDADYAAIPRHYRVAGSLDEEARIELFAARLEHYQVAVRRCTAAGLSRAIVDVLTGRGKRRIVVPAAASVIAAADPVRQAADHAEGADLLKDAAGHAENADLLKDAAGHAENADLLKDAAGHAESADLLKEAADHADSLERIAAHPNVLTFIPDTELTYHDLDHTDGVLTACTLAIAFTGTIVLTHGAGEGRRALTLIPDYHLCVVRAEQIVETVPEAMRRLQAIKPRLITTIAGPSATADIEMTRIRGVHGPRTLDVILVR